MNMKFIVSHVMLSNYQYELKVNFCSYIPANEICWKALGVKAPTFVGGGADFHGIAARSEARLNDSIGVD